MFFPVVYCSHYWRLTASSSGTLWKRSVTLSFNAVKPSEADARLHCSIPAAWTIWQQQNTNKALAIHVGPSSSWLQINCHGFTPKIVTCNWITTNWITAVAKINMEKEERTFFYSVSPTFSKYLISYSRMIPLGRSGSCQDKEMLFLAIFPFFTLVIGEGAAKWRVAWLTESSNSTRLSCVSAHLKVI